MHTTKQVKRLNFTTGITWGPSKWTILKLCIYLMATQKCLVLMAHMELGLFLVSDQLQRFRIHLDKNMIIQMKQGYYLSRKSPYHINLRSPHVFTHHHSFGRLL